MAVSLAVSLAVNLAANFAVDRVWFYREWNKSNNGITVKLQPVGKWPSSMVQFGILYISKEYSFMLVVRNRSAGDSSAFIVA